MKKKWLSILLCFCMALTLLPMSVLAAEYPDGWPSDPSVLTAEADTVTNDGVTYTYKGDASTSGIQMYTKDAYSNATALMEACCWKAGSGYVLYNPTVESGQTTSAEVTLHDAEISTSHASALALPCCTYSGDSVYSIPVTVTVEGENSLATSAAYTFTLYRESGDTVFTGGGTLSVTNSASWNFQSNAGAVTIEAGTQVALNGGTSNIVGNLLVTGSGSKLTIANDTKLIIGLLSNYIHTDTAPTVTVENGAVLENNGTLDMEQRTKAAPGITGEISGSGGILFRSESSTTLYGLVDGVFYPYGGDASDGLDLETSTPTQVTYYGAGNGYALFTPAQDGQPDTLTLHHASISTTGIPLTLGAETVIQLEGENSLTNTNAGSGTGISASAVTITGGIGDSLTVSAWQCTDVGALTVDGACSVTMDGSVYGIVSRGDMAIKNGAQVSATGGETGMALVLATDPGLTNLFDLTLEGGSALTVDGKTFAKNITLTGSGTALTINSGALLVAAGTITVGSGAALVNNGTLGLPVNTTPAQIQALGLTGSGVVIVSNGEAAGDYYTNGGTALTMISGDLDLSGDDTSGTGYTFNDNTLTLGNVYITGGITLPCATPVIISATGSSIISGGISAASDGSGYSHSIDLTFTGTAPLTIDGGIYNGVNNDIVTVQGGAQVTVNGSISIGDSGTDGTLTVTGAHTALNITAPYSPAVICDTVNVGSGAALTVHTQGDGSMGVEALSGGVNVTGGSTLTTGCDYGVYIIGGALTVDSTSKLVTNGAVAPFCIVDTTSPANDQSAILSLPGLPSGTEIASVLGTDTTYGNAYTYWSLIPTNGSLGVTDENSTPVTLTGTVTGTLTFAAAASTPLGGGGGGSVSYTLTFETNSGSAIDKLSKTSGTAVDLSGYKPTRDGYNFTGWYSDAALTTAVTSVTLTKSMTVYAKWTKTGENPFVDVPDGAYYHDAVLWAVESGITNGTTGTTFSSNTVCTRAQAVTFLWRSMGSPEPTSANCPFTDVAQDAYYYKAVLWAIEQGITKGTSATAFSPNDTVTRCQTMTFLWRTAGEAASSSANPFTDVVGNAYYYNAVLWAVEKEITQGTSTASFSPNGGCTRAQIVTFLYRYMGK